MSWFLQDSNNSIIMNNQLIKHYFILFHIIKKSLPFNNRDHIDFFLLNIDIENGCTNVCFLKIPITNFDPCKSTVIYTRWKLWKLIFGWLNVCSRNLQIANIRDFMENILFYLFNRLIFKFIISQYDEIFLNFLFQINIKMQWKSLLHIIKITIIILVKRILWDYQKLGYFFIKSYNIIISGIK